jgi:two-component system phosphate regulon response regulator PhoB
MSRETITVVEDDADIAELVTYNLEREGYGVSVVASGEEAIISIVEAPPDLVILDLMLPGVDGLEVCRRIRQEERVRSVPIIMLTAKSEDADIVAGLELGADDYVTKPFSPRVLIARVRAVLRRDRIRGTSATPDKLSVHGIDVNVRKHEVKYGGKPVDLSATEFAILVLLMGNPGWVFSRRMIISTVKGDDYPVTDRAVDVQILGLRKKLGDGGEAVETVRGYGYRLKDEVL